jgi:hypothetical protein
MTKDYGVKRKYIQSEKQSKDSHFPGYYSHCVINPVVDLQPGIQSAVYNKRCDYFALGM